MAQINRKLCPSCLIFQNHMSYDLHLWCTCVKGNISRFCKHFSQILIFRVSSRVKGQKMTQNDRKLCLSSYITQEAYIVCSWFWVHICKMMTSPDAFFIFSKFWFARLLGGERAKIGPKWQKILCHSVCQEWYPMWFWFLMHMCKMISPAIFFIFSKFWFLRSLRAKNDP